jgi:hypothetical protein
MVLCTVRGIICAIGELEKGVYAQLVEWVWRGEFESGALKWKARRAWTCRARFRFLIDCG